MRYPNKTAPPPQHQNHPLPSFLYCARQRAEIFKNHPLEVDVSCGKYMCVSVPACGGICGICGFVGRATTCLVGDDVGSIPTCCALEMWRCHGLQVTVQNRLVGPWWIARGGDPTARRLPLPKAADSDLDGLPWSRRPGRSSAWPPARITTVRGSCGFQLLYKLPPSS